jgi:hypothetical protein
VVVLGTLIMAFGPAFCSPLNGVVPVNPHGAASAAAYRGDLSAFSGFLGDVVVETITADQIRKFLIRIPLPSTRSRRLAGIKAFFDYLEITGRTDNPTKMRLAKRDHSSAGRPLSPHILCAFVVTQGDEFRVAQMVGCPPSCAVRKASSHRAPGVRATSRVWRFFCLYSSGMDEANIRSRPALSPKANEFSCCGECRRLQSIQISYRVLLEN